MGIELHEPAPIEILQVRIGAGERKIDVIEHTGVGGARLARCARHQPLGERRDGRRIVVIEKGAVPATTGMCMVHRHGLGHFLPLGRFGASLGQQRGGGNGPGSHRCAADQKGAACFIVLFHVWFLRVLFELVLCDLALRTWIVRRRVTPVGDTADDRDER